MHLSSGTPGRAPAPAAPPPPPPHAHLILPHELEALGPHRPVEHWHRPLGFESDNEAALSRDLEVGAVQGSFRGATQGLVIEWEKYIPIKVRERHDLFQNVVTKLPPSYKRLPRPHQLLGCPGEFEALTVKRCGRRHPAAQPLLCGNSLKLQGHLQEEEGAPSDSSPAPALRQ